MVFGKDKIVGTFVPVFSLRSSTQTLQDQGTFDTGLILLDWLIKTKQNAWQMLPLSETQLEKGSKTKHVPSPYKGYGIGLDPKYLSSKYKSIIPTEMELKDFYNKHDFWLKDYVLFCALREHFGTDDWRKWDNELVTRDRSALKKWSEKLEKSISFFTIQQWRLHMSYDKLHEKAKKLGIVLIGDLPFYLSLNSPLVWKYQNLFQINENGEMEYVSGAVNKVSSHYGRQVWGHPLYRWDKLKEVTAFWEMRLLYRSFLYDVIRFDYSTGFFEYAAKDPNNPEGDKVYDGPGKQFLDHLILFSKKHNLIVFVEDSGKEVKKLRQFLDGSSVSGIRIFRFAYNEIVDSIVPYYAEVYKYPANTVIYPTTHDTETLISYLKLLTEKQKKQLADTSKIVYDKNDHTFAKSILAQLINSPSKTVIIPIQDWLLSDSRINVPGTEKEINDTNWQYELSTPIEDLPIQL